MNAQRSKPEHDQDGRRQRAHHKEDEREAMNEASPITRDDPRLTALALDEGDSLSAADLRLISTALAQDADLRAELDDVRAFGMRLRAELVEEDTLSLTEAQLEALRSEAGRNAQDRLTPSGLILQFRRRVAAMNTMTRLGWAMSMVAIVWIICVPLGMWTFDKFWYSNSGMRIQESMARPDRPSSAHESQSFESCFERMNKDGEGMADCPYIPTSTPLKDRIKGQLGLDAGPDESAAAPRMVAAGAQDATGIGEVVDAQRLSAVGLDPQKAGAVSQVIPPNAAPPASDAAQASASAAPPVPAPRDPNRRIIKDAALGLEVARLDSALSQVEGIAAQAGGDILESKRVEGQGPRRAFVRLAVPVDQFEFVLGRLRTIATVVLADQASSSDVSQEFVDLQSQLASLEATQARIRSFLAQAKDVEEALKVNTRLQEIEGQMNTIKGRLQYLSTKAAYSTIAVDLVEQLGTPTVTPTPSATATPTSTPSPTPVAAYDPVQPAREAYSVLRTLLRRLSTLAIWLGVVVLPLAALAGAAWWLASRGVGWLRRWLPGGRYPT